MPISISRHTAIITEIHLLQCTMSQGIGWKSRNNRKRYAYVACNMPETCVASEPFCLDDRNSARLNISRLCHCLTINKIFMLIWSIHLNNLSGPANLYITLHSLTQSLQYAWSENEWITCTEYSTGCMNADLFWTEWCYVKYIHIDQFVIKSASSICSISSFVASIYNEVWFKSLGYWFVSIHAVTLTLSILLHLDNSTSDSQLVIFSKGYYTPAAYAASLYDTVVRCIIHIVHLLWGWRIECCFLRVKFKPANVALVTTGHHLI